MAVIQQEFKKSRTILEIGSGTGQHAIFFAENLPHLTWQTSDQTEYIDGINQWIKDSASLNVLPPFELNVKNQWPAITYGGAFSANTAHIMSWPEVESMFEGIGKALINGAAFCLYGPFNYHNTYTSQSNENFDQWLKNRDMNSGIKNFENLVSLAEENSLYLKDDHDMPANNRILVWSKEG